MSQAKSMKLREYGTNILSHQSDIQVPEAKSVRNNNTFKSSIINEDKFSSTQTLKQARSSDRLTFNNPLTAKVARASYQDSNIFGYKGTEDPTVQGKANDLKQSRQRYNPTYNSQVFRDDAGQSGDAGEQERPRSKNRHEDKWQSSVFDGPIEEKPKRKKLGQADQNVDELFGKDKCDFGNKSNTMPVIGVPKQTKQWKPVREQKTAEQRKNEELYGRSAAIYGTGKKGDGSLMANGADWRNLQQTHTNGKNNTQQSGDTLNSKDKKYQNLQSNILANEEKDQQVTYNTEIDKVAFASNSGWTAQGGAAKIINKGSRVDTFKKKQQQLSSQVFETTDYSEHVPMKKKRLDINNINDKKRKNDHLYSDIFGNEGSVRSPTGTKKAGDLVLSTNDWATADVKQQIKKDYTNYTTKDQKLSQMKSSLDTHTYDPEQFRQCKTEIDEDPITIQGKSSRATKVKDLSSDILGTGNNLSRYNEIKQTTIVDLDVAGLPEHAQPEDLKKISGVKHVINATIEQDAIRNICTGNGRIKIRITEDEDLDSIKLGYIKQGYSIREHEENPKKKTEFSQQMSLQTKMSPRQDIEAKATKMQNLQSNDPQVFGNNSSRQAKFQTDFDTNEVNQVKAAVQDESHAVNQWAKMGPRK